MKTRLKIFQVAVIPCSMFLWAMPAVAQRATMMPAYSNDQPGMDQSDAGGEYISIIGVRPLDEVIDELQPHFDLTAEEALQKAVPDTLNSSKSSSLSSTFSLQVGLITALLNSANLSNSTASSQSTVLNILTNFPFALNLDPELQYKAAASLYERVQLLNRSLKDIPHFHGYVPYIITVQISLIPYRHDAPYDTYADLSFFTDTNEAPESPGLYSETIPLVYPTPTADALEMSNDQQSQNQLQELNLTLAAAAHGVGGQAGASRQKESNEAASGYNLNSLVTVGRLSQNCVEVRIGARNTAGSDRFNMVPETHNVTLLVFAPKDANELEMLSHAVFRNFGSDEVLTELPDQRVENQFLTNVVEYWFSDLSHRKVKKTFKDQLRKETFFHKETPFQKAYDDFLFKSIIRIVFDTNSKDSSTFLSFQQAFRSFFKDPKVEPLLKKAGVDESFFANPFYGLNANGIDALWLDTVRATDLGDQYANDRVQLRVASPDFPATNLTVLRTDANQTTTLTISGCHRLTTNKIHAVLTCSNGFAFHDDWVDVTNDGTTLKMQFPMLSALTSSGTGTTNFEPTNLELYSDANGTADISSNYTHFAEIGSNTKSDSNTKAKSESGGQAVGWETTRTYGALTAGITNDFGIVLETNSSAASSAYFLDVAGAIVTTATNYAGGLLLRKPNGMFPLDATNSLQELVFTLKPLPACQSVDFNLWNDKGLVTNLSHQVVYLSNPWIGNQ